MSGSMRAVIATFAPAPTSAFAIARPMPREPPVTIADLPVKFTMSALQLLQHSFVDDLRIRLPFRRLDHLAHKEPNQRFLARSVCSHLTLIGGDYAIDERVNLPCVADLH